MVKGVIGEPGAGPASLDFLPTMMAESQPGPIRFSWKTSGTIRRAENPAVQTAYSTMNARALAVPLLKNQRLTAVLVMHSSEPRAWFGDELSLVEDVAERTWTAVEKARAEAELRVSRSQFRMIGEALPAFVWVLEQGPRAHLRQRTLDQIFRACRPPKLSA